MNILIVGDAFQSLKVATDSSLEIARQALRLNHSVFWAEAHQVWLYLNELRIDASALHSSGDQPISGTRVPLQIESHSSTCAASDFHMIFIRKDPPLDATYFQMLWLLATYERRLAMVNRPSALLRYHEKMIPREMVADGLIGAEEILPLTVVQRHEQILKMKDHFLKKESLRKPFLGHGGRGVTMLNQDPSTWWTDAEPYSIFQNIEEAIRNEGSFRAFYFNKQWTPAFKILPQQGSIVSNIASGGRAERRDFSSKELSLCERIGTWLQERGIFMAGADFIGDHLNEINITSPTGFVVLRELGGPSIIEEGLDRLMNDAHFL